MISHTKAPWEDNGNGLIYGQVSGDEDEAPFVADVCHHPDNYTEQEKANARRIVAAVNACEGLSTEALEQGVIGELRQALGTLLTAAADLDAAMDGATGQFDDQRAGLDAASRMARATAAGTEIDLHELLAARGQIAHLWSVEDVQEVRPDLTKIQAWDVLSEVRRTLDATLGVNWLTLELTAEDLFGDAPERDEE